MTGYTVHTGSTEKFSDGWDRIFDDVSKSRKKPASGRSKAKTRKSTAKSAAKSTGKRAPAKKK